ncbi:hypothetical protein BDQ17DRAFT_1434632 [Cyathus striatus]|nr:hypothetical protein BDQ17DRAFT_1434632 [Cyathus striatus]
MPRGRFFIDPSPPTAQNMFSSELLKQSKLFNKPDADVTFKSSDRVLFALHKENLANHAGGFPPADSTVGAETIDLAEESEILELLFQFVYPLNDVPDLLDVPLTLLMKLSRAAEKYVVHIAIPLCKMRMFFIVRSYYTSRLLKDSAKDDLKLIVKYTLDHSGYKRVMDEAAPLLAVSEPLESTLFMFPPERQSSWALYREQWAVAQRFASSELSTHKAGCSSECRSSSTDLKLDSCILHLEDFSLSTGNCYYLEKHWKKSVSQKINDIRKFSSVCDQLLQP